LPDPVRLQSISFKFSDSQAKICGAYVEPEKNQAEKRKKEEEMESKEMNKTRNKEKNIRGGGGRNKIR
jgi:hypothetical protein